MDFMDSVHEQQIRRKDELISTISSIQAKLEGLKKLEEANKSYRRLLHLVLRDGVEYHREEIKKELDKYMRNIEDENF